jgi:ribosomal protein S3
MGQKTNPIIFKLNKTKRWKANYTEKKSNEFYLYSLQQLEIRKFINNFFSNYKLQIKNCKINYTNTFLDIYVSYYQYKLFFNKLKNKTKNVKNIKFNNIQINKQKKIKKKKMIKLLKKFKSIDNYNDVLHLKKFKTIKKYDSITKFKKFKIIDDYNEVVYFKNCKSLHKKKILLYNKKRRYRLKRLKLIILYKRLLKINKYKNFNNFNNSFLENFFNSLNIFLNKKIKISIKLEHLKVIDKKNIVKKEHSLIKKQLIKLKKYEKLNVFKEGVNLIYTALKNKNSAELIANFISVALQKNKRHNFVLRFLKACIFKFKKGKNSKIRSIKIQIKGRFNRSRRARKRTYKMGQKMPLLTINANIKYAEDISITSNGTFGIKVWVFEKDINKRRRKKIKKC